MKLQNVIVACQEGPDTGQDGAAIQKWDIELKNGVVRTIEAAVTGAAAADCEPESLLMLPALCHPHLHLDKAYILTGHCSDGGQPSYADLLPQTGTFEEALKSTAVAKARFTDSDLHRRGAQLLASSWRQGVTTARVFVEVDAGAADEGAVAVAVARRLKAEFRGRVDLQVCAFAQEPLFTAAAGGEANRAALLRVLEANRADGDSATIAVLGVTPYVEASRELALCNIDWAVATALEYGLHLDLHLDYNLRVPYGVGSSSGSHRTSHSHSSSTNPSNSANPSHSDEPLIFALLAALERHDWCGRARCQPGDEGGLRTVVVGHATQLTRLSQVEMELLAATIHSKKLPVHLVGLPTSDVYMMGRQPDTPDGSVSGIGHSPRGTLPVPQLIRQFGLDACLGVNNVGNAFTPYGTGDPLLLACWGVGLYHAGTPADAELLYGCVSWRARRAIGMDGAGGDGTFWTADPVGPADQKDQKDRPALPLQPSSHIGPVLVIENPRFIPLPTEADALLLPLRVPARPRLGFGDVVWDPPDVSLRSIV